MSQDELYENNIPYKTARVVSKHIHDFRNRNGVINVENNINTLSYQCQPMQTEIDEYNNNLLYKTHDLSEEAKTLIQRLIYNQLSKSLPSYPTIVFNKYAQNMIDGYFYGRKKLKMCYRYFLAGTYAFMKELFFDSEFQWVKLTEMQVLFPNLENITIEHVSLCHFIMSDIYCKLVTHPKSKIKRISLQQTNRANSTLCVDAAVFRYGHDFEKMNYLTHVHAKESDQLCIISDEYVCAFVPEPTFLLGEAHNSQNDQKVNIQTEVTEQEGNPKVDKFLVYEDSLGNVLACCNGFCGNVFGKVISSFAQNELNHVHLFGRQLPKWGTCASMEKYLIQLLDRKDLHILQIKKWINILDYLYKQGRKYTLRKLANELCQCNDDGILSDVYKPYSSFTADDAMIIVNQIKSTRYFRFLERESGTLTDDEILAIYLYTGYEKVSSGLRKSHRTGDSCTYQRLYFNVLHGIKKLNKVFVESYGVQSENITHPHELYHGIGNVMITEQEAPTKDKPWKFNTITSFTTNKKVARSYAGDNGCVLKLSNVAQHLYKKTLMAAPVGFIAIYQKEQEWIVLPIAITKAKWIKVDNKWFWDVQQFSRTDYFNLFER
eukprot:555000_1